MSFFDFVKTYDFNQSETQVVCDLVYISSKYRINPNVVTFGDAKEIDQRPEIEDDPNSYIPAFIKNTFDTRMVPEETGFLYHRIPLSAIQATGPAITPPTVPFKTYDILSQINAQLGVSLRQSDLVNTTYTTLDDNFVLTASPSSKIWTGYRYLNVTGGGIKNLLYPNELLVGTLGATDIQADKQAQITSIANQDNSKSWVVGTDFTLGNMEGVTTDIAGRNTKIYVKSLKTGYIDQWLYYRRYAPSTINDQFVNTPVASVSIPFTAFTIYGILSLINAALNLNLTTDDVFDASYQPGLSQYPIVFKSTSLGWLTGTYVMNVTYSTPDLTDARLVGNGNVRLIGNGSARTYD